MKTNEVDTCNSRCNSSHRKLLEIFSMEQLALIEYAYEGSQYITVHDGRKITFTKEDTENIVNMFNHNDIKCSLITLRSNTIYEIRYGDENYEIEKLNVICQNIIHNKGTFNPKNFKKYGQ